jgi:predicted RNase H-like HicB family nuclease
MNLKDFQPIVVDQIFSKDQYDDIYDRVNKTFPSELTADVPENSGYMNAGEIGYFAYVNGFRDDVYKAVKDVAEANTGLKLGSPEIHFARYSLKTGHSPILRPHNDLMLKHPSITMSIQLESSFDWELFANFHSAMLHENQGMIFSGSHQMHWRPRVEFKEDDYYDIMVCQMKASDEILGTSHEEEMFALKREVLEKYFQTYPENVNSLPKTTNMQAMFLED